MVPVGCTVAEVAVAGSGGTAKARGPPPLPGYTLPPAITRGRWPSAVALHCVPGPRPTALPTCIVVMTLPTTSATLWPAVKP